MATIGNTYLDLIELYTRQGPDGKQIATIIEMLSQTNSILEDAIALEANNGTGHRTTVRTGLPAVTWGQLYKGIPQSKSETAQVEDTTGFVEALSSVDKRLLDLSQNGNALRLSEAQSFLEAMNNEVATKMFYGDETTAPDQFTGLSPRFNDLGAENGGQIVNGGGAGADNTSIWFVSWGERQTHLLYPGGTSAGISREDKGEQRVTDANGDAYFTMEELFRWHIGLTVRDWRFVSRIANVDVSLALDGTTDMYELMRKAFWKIRPHNVTGGKRAIYCNSDIMEALDAATTPTNSTTASFVRLSPDESDGKEVLTYRGIPIRQVDALANDEELVT